MSDEIRVHVVKYSDRDNLMMRYRDPYNGRHVARSTGTADPKEALRAAAKWEDDLHNGRYKAASRVTWEEFRDKYETEVLTGLAKATDAKVTGVLDSVETHINPERVRDITSERLSHYVAKLRKAGRAESTIAGHLAHLKAALSYAVEWGYLAKVPELPRQQRAKRSNTMKGRPITGEEFDRMIAATTAVVGPDVAGSWQRLFAWPVVVRLAPERSPGPVLGPGRLCGRRLPGSGPERPAADVGHSGPTGQGSQRAAAADSARVR